MLTGEQFDRTRRLASSLAGIELADRHRELLAHRSRRIGIRDAAGLDALLDAAEEGESSATQQLLCLLTTKFTGFFRHPRHFQIATEHARHVASPRGQARLWSAGTATGEEAWSLAMAMAEVFQRDDPPVQILATDVDAEALVTAERGEYSEAALDSLTPERRKRFFTASGVTGDGRPHPARTNSGSAKMRPSLAVTSSLRRFVEFRMLNLADVTWPVIGPFDVIFCRNVLMYLEAGHRYAVLERMASLISPEGLLVLDPAEHLGRAAHLFASRGEGVYAPPRVRRPARGHAERRLSTGLRNEL